MSKLPKFLIFSLTFMLIAAILVIRLISSGAYIYWQFWVPVLFWLLGGFLGYLTLFVDRIVDIYVANPDTELAGYVKGYWAKKDYKKGWQVLMHNRRLQGRLTFRSAIFQVVWVFLAIFTVTSTTSMFGQGFVLGLGFHLLLDQWQDFVSDRVYLKKWLFWQINHNFSDQELRIYLVVMTIFTALFFFNVAY